MRSSGLSLEIATADDVEVVLELLRAASTARAATKTSPWDGEFPDVVRDVANGQVHLARLHNKPVGTFLMRWSDQHVWGPDDGMGGYVHRLATHPDMGGLGIGASLLQCAAEITVQHGRTWLRLDCDRNNPGLRKYYETSGFVHVRDVGDVPRQSGSGHRSASLYQLRASEGLTLALGS
jgi:ribosomal protein S18 acetylase RimI-like enzyme